MKRKIIMPTPEEDRLINAGIAGDSDTHEATKEDFAKIFWGNGLIIPEDLLLLSDPN